MGRRPDTFFVALVATILIAWLSLAFGDGILSSPIFCSSGAIPIPVLLMAPGELLRSALVWIIMVLAMMMPLAAAPLRHVRERSFARRQHRSMLWFVAGFVAAWMPVGCLLLMLVWLLQTITPNAVAAIILASALALLWQVCPAKQWFLNRCHRRPALAAFGADADIDAFGFGAAIGALCAGACWALMLVTMLIVQGQIVAMAAVTVFSLAESLERPAPLTWRWRGCGKAIRIIRARWPVASKHTTVVDEVYP